MYFLNRFIIKYLLFSSNNVKTTSTIWSDNSTCATVLATCFNVSKERIKQKDSFKLMIDTHHTPKYLIHVV